MGKILLLFLFLMVIFIYGCGKEETIEEESPGKITAYTYKIDDVKEEEKEESIATVRICYDTDKGIVRWVNGSVSGFYENATRFELNDYCFDQNILIEYYCENEIPKNRSFICKNTCEDNHCL